MNTIRQLPAWRILCSRCRSRTVLRGRLILWSIVALSLLLWAIGVWKWSTYNIWKAWRMVEDIYDRPLARFNDTIFDKVLVMTCFMESYAADNRITNFSCYPEMRNSDLDPIELPPGQLELFLDEKAQMNVKNSTDAKRTWIGPKPFIFNDIVAYDPPWIFEVPSTGLNSLNPWEQPDVGYPFDRALWFQAISATYNGTNIPIIGVSMESYLLNHFAYTHSFILRGCVDTTGSCYLNFAVSFVRPSLVKFAALIVLVLNWFVTLGLVALTGDRILAKREEVVKGTDELAVYFAALFALPTIREALPGAPGFGCLFDMIGILPNLILISICAFSLTIRRILGRSS